MGGDRRGKGVRARSAGAVAAGRGDGPTKNGGQKQAAGTPQTTRDRTGADDATMRSQPPSPPPSSEKTASSLSARLESARKRRLEEEGPAGGDAAPKAARTAASAPEPSSGASSSRTPGPPEEAPTGKQCASCRRKGNFPNPVAKHACAYLKFANEAECLICRNLWNAVIKYTTDRVKFRSNMKKEHHYKAFSRLSLPDEIRP